MTQPETEHPGAGTFRYYIPTMEHQLREKLAALVAQCEEYVEGDGIHMPRWCVERWSRQMNAPYADLSEEEKESDRKEADRVLEVLHHGGRKAILPG
jgi:hypothetical protein